MVNFEGNNFYMTRFIVHVGDGKCGGTSIQNSLYNVREKLRGHGIIYGTSTPKNGHFSLVTLVGRTRGSAKLAEENAQNTIEMIRKGLAAGDADTVLLSAESFFQIGPENLLTIMRKISDHIDRVDVIAYVRSPHNMYLSLVQQTLKGDSRFTPPDVYSRRIDNILDSWRCSEHIDSLTVHNFDRDMLVGGDVVTDFESILRDLTDHETLSLPPATENTSLSAEQIVVLQQFRAECLKAHDGKAHRDSQAVVAYFESLTSLGVPGSKPVLTTAALANLRRGNAAIIERMNTRFPGLELKLPEVAPEVPPEERKGTSDDRCCPTDSTVETILARVDPRICEILRGLIPGFHPQLTQNDISDIVETLRKLATIHGFNLEPVLRRTVAFWRAMKSPVRADILAEMLADPNTVTAQTPHPMILYGKQRWLFLKSDSNRVQEQIAGTFPLPEDFQFRWAELFEQRAEMARQMGYRYCYSVAPNKECVYAEQLPDNITVSEDRPIRHVLAAAKGRVLHRYHLEPLRRMALLGEDSFVRGDTHWNHDGALIAFNETMRALDLPELPVSDFVSEQRDIEADLSIKMGVLCPTTVLTIRNPRFRLVDNNQVNNIGQRRIYENEDKSLPSCVFFRDSFTSHQLDMFASQFSRIVFLWQPNIDYGIVKAESPDVVINQQAERFLVSCPDDQTGPSHRDYEAKKLKV